MGQAVMAVECKPHSMRILPIAASSQTPSAPASRTTSSQAALYLTQADIALIRRDCTTLPNMLLTCPVNVYPSSDDGCPVYSWPKVLQVQKSIKASSGALEIKY